MTDEQLDELELRWETAYDGKDVCELIAEVRRLRGIRGSSITEHHAVPASPIDKCQRQDGTEYFSDPCRIEFADVTVTDGNVTYGVSGCAIPKGTE